MKGDHRPAVAGLVASTIRFRSKVVLSWDLWIAVAAGAAAIYFVPDTELRPALTGLTSAGLAVATALVGVVIAALAVVVAFLDDDFIALMDKATQKYGGMEGQLFPFWFVTGLGVTTILMSVAAIAFGQDASTGWARALVGVLTCLLVWTALGVLNLVSYIHATGVSRALLIRRRREADDSKLGGESGAS